MRKSILSLKSNIAILLQAGLVNLDQFKPLTDADSAPAFSAIFNSGSLPQFFNALFTMALAGGAILAVLKISYAGWKYMGSDIWGNKTQAKTDIQNAVIGLLLLIGTYTILYQINPDILQLNILRSVGANTSQNNGWTTGGGF